MRRSAGAVAVLLVALAVLSVLAASATSPGSPADDPSSRATGKAGTLALYTWLDQLGFTVHRLAGSFDTGDTDVLIIAEPTVDIGDSEVTSIRSYLNGGGDVILAVDGDGATHAAALLSKLGLGPGTSHDAATAHPVQPIDAGDRVHDVPIGPGPSFAADPTVVPLLAAGGNTVGVIATAAAGGQHSGRAYVLGSALPLSNDGLRHGDSASLVLTLLERARGGRIAVDEYHHGEIGDAGAAAIYKGPVGLAGGLAVVVLLLFLTISGRRLGRAVPAGPPGRVPSAAEYITAMAGLLERSQLRGGVADRYADELKRRVGAVAGCDPRLADAEFVAALTGYGAPARDAVGQALARARDLAAGRPSQAALVQLAAHIESIERGWAGTATGMAPSLAGSAGDQPSQWPP